MGSFDFGVARLIEMIEERFGRLAGNVFLIIVVLAILSISIYTIGVCAGRVSRHGR